MRRARQFLVFIFIAAVVFLAFRYFYDRSVMEKIIDRLRADSRVAEVLVTGVAYDEALHKNQTTIKFLEYDTQGQPLAPKYFTFSGNIIQFQSLVVRFDDKFVMAGDRLRGRSAYLFWKVFMLDGKSTEEFPLINAQQVPDGYRVGAQRDPMQERFWGNFWKYALEQQAAAGAGIKNAQIEAPGTMFVPGYLYTITIEHDGGLRIDTHALPPIVRGEKVL